MKQYIYRTIQWVAYFSYAIIFTKKIRALIWPQFAFYIPALKIPIKRMLASKLNYFALSKTFQFIF